MVNRGSELDLTDAEWEDLHESVHDPYVELSRMVERRLSDCHKSVCRYRAAELKVAAKSLLREAA